MGEETGLQDGQDWEKRRDYRIDRIGRRDRITGLTGSGEETGLQDGQDWKRRRDYRIDRIGRRDGITGWAGLGRGRKL